jgi:hypothetical protein
MATPVTNIGVRGNILKSILDNEDQQRAVENALKTANGDWAKAVVQLKDVLPPAAFQKVTLAYALADWSGDNGSIVRALANRQDVTSLRDVALTFNAEKLAGLVKPNILPVKD